MTIYFYKDGSEVKENDIVFYSEDRGDHTLHYADSIGIIIEHEGDLKMKTHVITMDDGKTFQDYDEPESNCISLKYGCINFYPWNKDLPNTLQCFTKIGEYPKNKNMLSADYAMSFAHNPVQAGTNYHEIITFYAKIIGIGGSSKTNPFKIVVEKQDGTKHSITINSKQDQKIANSFSSIYRKRDVRLTVKARINLLDDKQDYLLEEISIPKEISLIKNIEQLQKDGLDAWDHISDSINEIRSLRNNKN